MKPEVLRAQRAEPLRSILQALYVMAAGAGIGALVFILTFSVVFAFALAVMP